MISPLYIYGGGRVGQEILERVKIQGKFIKTKRYSFEKSIQII